MPASEGFHRLRSLRITGRAAEHSRAETHALGQLVVADNASVRQLFTYLLSFASGARSFAGLESLFLSSMVNLQARNENLLYRLGIQAWASYEPATKYLSAESLLTILDGENALVTMLPGSSLGFLHQFLIAHGFSSISLGAAIRNPSSVTEVPYDDTWTLNRPGGMFSGESFGRCAAKVTGILTVAGLLGGEGIGAGAGGIIGGIVSGWMCADPPPSDPGLPVSDSPQSPPSDASAPDQEPPDDMSSSDANQGGSGVPPDDPNSAGSGDAGSSGNSSGSDNPQGQEGPDQSLPDGSNQSVGSGGTDGDNGSDPSGSGGHYGPGDDGTVDNYVQDQGGPDDGSTVGSRTPELVHIHKTIGLRIQPPPHIGKRILAESLSVPHANSEGRQQLRYGNSLTFVLHGIPAQSRNR